MILENNPPQKEETVSTVLFCFLICLFIYFWPHREAGGILVSQPGTGLKPPAMEASRLDTRLPGKILHDYSRNSSILLFP